MAIQEHSNIEVDDDDDDVLGGEPQGEEGCSREVEKGGGGIVAGASQHSQFMGAQLKNFVIKQNCLNTFH